MTLEQAAKQLDAHDQRDGGCKCKACEEAEALIKMHHRRAMLAMGIEVK